MNASASHGSISDCLIDVEVFDRKTREIKVIPKNECGFGFRSSIFQSSNYIITMVRFQLGIGKKDELIKLYDDIIRYRERNYPLTFPSAGCWFKRDWGGNDIIDKIGMVGAINGGAVISPMFPSFILNTGNATAKEVYSLVMEIQNKASNIGEEMPCEIILWGEIWKEQ
jgi:UDP-N-acetylmuramate dehydrogenase